MLVLFVTDIHGSTLVFRKAIAAAIDFSVDALILGGDLSGKRMVRIEPCEGGNYTIYEPYRQKDDTGRHLDRFTETTVSDADLKPALKRLEAKGYYWHLADSEELRRLNDDTEQLRFLWNTKISARLLDWAQYLNDKLPVPCYWTGGNDDDPDMLTEVVRHDLGAFQYSEGRVVELGSGFDLISLGYSNETGFDTPRELKDDSELERRLASFADRASSTERLLLNVHVPPKNCGHLDECLDRNDPSVTIHAGSDGVRAFIENYQPLADFVGHIHEAKEWPASAEPMSSIREVTTTPGSFMLSLWRLKVQRSAIMLI